jgi:hypothetical protein
MSEPNTKLKTRVAELAKFSKAELTAPRAELEAEIDALKAQVEALEAEHQALEAEHQALKAKCQTLRAENDNLPENLLRRLDVAWMKDCDFDLISFCEYLWKVGRDKGALMSVLAHCFVERLPVPAWAAVGGLMLINNSKYGEVGAKRHARDLTRWQKVQAFRKGGHTLEKALQLAAKEGHVGKDAIVKSYKAVRRKMKHFMALRRG